MKVKMIYLDYFETELEGKKYTIYQFVEPKTLNIFNGTNLKGTFVQYQEYTCELVLKKGKLKIINAQ